MESNQTPGDQRVIAAREFLDGAHKRKVGELPPPLLMREDAVTPVRPGGIALRSVCEHAARSRRDSS